MKFSFRIFIFTYCILVLAMGIGSFIFIDRLYKAELEETIQNVQEDNRSMYAYINTIYDLSNDAYVRYSMNVFAGRMYSGSSENTVYVQTEEERKDSTEETVLLNNQVITEITGTEEDAYVQVTSRYGKWYMVNRYSLAGVFAHRENNYNVYRLFIIGISVVMAVLLYAFAGYITKPVKKLTHMAKRVSGGDYSARVDTGGKNMKSEEMHRLGDTLNRLAENTENHIEELNDMLERREAFMADFTHEIKTPLTSIIGYGDILRTYEISPEKCREYGEFMYKEGKRLEQLSMNLLKLIVMGREEIVLKEFKTDRLQRTLVQTLKPVGERYGIYIICHMEKTVILAEESLLVTMLNNLAENGLKASEKGQRVIIEGRISGDGYTVTVEDFGRGIPKEQQVKIWEPFYMADKSRARSMGGSGLGLALCKRIAELHKGSIKLESEVGKGTKITVYIQRV